MKFSASKIGAVALSAAALLSTAPGAVVAAESVYMNPNAGITKVWKKNPEKYGQPLSTEKCVKGKGCEQIFENAVLTWNQRNGVDALMGADRVKAYQQAGGVAAVGAVESDAWNHAQCGPVVTTYDGSTRWLVVVGDEKAKAASKLDLSSQAAKDWRTTRNQTGACFTGSEHTPEPQQPAPTPEHPVGNGWEKVNDFISARVLYSIDEGINFQYDVYEVFDARTGYTGYMDGRVYNEFIKNPDFFGKFTYTHKVGDDRGGARYNFFVSNFERPSGESVDAWGDKIASVGYTIYSAPDAQGKRTSTSGVIDNEPAFTPTNPVNVDWSQQPYVHFPGLPNEDGGALFYQDGENSAIIIKADANGKPVAGAQAYRSDWLGYFMSREGRFDINQATDWAYGGYLQFFNEVSTLGVPVAEQQKVTENGVTYLTQEFEHGSIKWEVPAEGATAKKAEITLHPDAQAALVEYEKTVY